MKRIIALVCFFVLFAGTTQGYAFAVTNSGVNPGNAYIPQGTVLDAEIVGGVNSGENAVGDLVYFKALQNVAVDGVVVIPYGTIGFAEVKEVKPAWFLGRGGSIEVRAKYIQALNGTLVPLNFEMKKTGDSVNVLVPMLAIKGYSLLIRGYNRSIPVGTKIQVAVADDVDLRCTAETLPLVMVPGH